MVLLINYFVDVLAQWLFLKRVRHVMNIGGIS